MEPITIALSLMVAVVVSGFLSRTSPVPLPLPLVQIALGAAIGSITDLTVKLQPEVFFLLFLPPLLFLDGWRIPKEGLLRDKGPILELALGLVVFTVLGLGFFIHWMIPAMPLAVAFALAAILSPTDPIAVSAIAARVPIPKRMMHILEGESLLNDASGLVCMRFAVAAALTGSFSLPNAIVTFLWLAVGGVAIGVGVTWCVTKAKNWLTRRIGEETGSEILISLLIPFGAYILAEHFHCSGILAAVAAGITMSYAEISGHALAITRVRRTAVWDAVQFSANGIIFVLLGEQLPGLVAGAAGVVREAEHHDESWLAIYVLAVTLALAILRFVWVWVSLRLTLHRAARTGKPSQAVSWRILAAMSVAGVRGAVTLAGVLTLPLAMPDGSAFPARELAIFIAAGVIILSLVLASVALPRLLRGLELPPEPSHHSRVDKARRAAAEAAIQAINRAEHAMAQGRSDADLYAETASRIMEIYRRRIEGQSKTGKEAEANRKAYEIERKLRLAGLRAERNEIFRITRAGGLDDDVARKIVREIDLLEADLTGLSMRTA